MKNVRLYLFLGFAWIRCPFIEEEGFVLGNKCRKISFFNRWFVKKVLKVAKIVMVRDQHSQELWRKWGLSHIWGVISRA